MWDFIAYNFQADFHYVFAFFESKDFQGVFLNVSTATYVPTYVTNIRETRVSRTWFTYVKRAFHVRESRT